jgi:type II secretory pathway component GspD/PulD (secretin)
MKRLRELTALSLIILVGFGFIADYTATASAPGIREEIDPQYGVGLDKAARGSYVRQIIATSPLPLSDISNTVAFDDEDLTALTKDVPEVKEPTPGIVSIETDTKALSELNALTLSEAVQADGNYCDPNFVGGPITFSQTSQLSLEDLLEQIHNRFGINFLMGPNLRQLPINIKTGSIPWNVLLRSQLFVSGVRARCINANTIELVQNVDLPKLQDGADATTKFVKLKFLQRTSGGTVDLAGRSQGSQNQGGCSGASGGGSSGGLSGGGGGSQQTETAASQGSSRFDKLIIEIEKILGIRSMTESSAGGGGSGSGAVQTEERRTNRFVTQIPGRNILVIRATEEEHALINEIIGRADRPPFQVVIKGLVYTANEDRLRDIGVQSSVVFGTPDLRQLGGVTNQPPVEPTAPNTVPPGQPNPGGIRTLGPGFPNPLGDQDGIFGLSAIVGTAQFSVQATAFQQNGVISVKSRPFAAVIDGLCTQLNVGRELPIVIDSTLGGQGDVVFVNAANNLAVTPYVIDDENGNPMAVTLDLRLDANDIDSSVTARGVPAVSRRSIQTQLLLGEDKTAILGGFTVDQDSKTVSKTPILGDIPIVGELFKRRIRDTRINRLYFAISVSVVPYGEAIEPVQVPGATTNPPSLTPTQLDRSNKAEPKQVVPPNKDN